MPRSSTPRLLMLALGSAVFVGALALPALASTPPADITGLTGAVGDHVAVLSWSGGGSAGSIVRDVTGVSGTLTPTSGKAVAPVANTARDPRFLNLGAHTYDVWAVDTDGTTSANPASVTVNTIAPLATSLTIGTSRSVATYGKQYAVSGALSRGGLVSAANQRVDLLARVGGTSTYTIARTLKTDSSGNVKAVLTSTHNLDLALRYAGDAFSQASGSDHKIVNMQPTLTYAFAPNVIVKPQGTVLKGAVPPGLTGTVVRIQRKTAGGYGTIASVKPASNGSWSYSYSPGGIGVFGYRAVLPASASYLSVTSATHVLEIDTRDLQLGDKGDDVKALEARLKSLHYSPGAVDGTYDRNTEHAVIAFEKVERLPRNGTWTKAERTRVQHPTTWKLKYPTSGRAVEVDFTRQVVVYSVNGVVTYIMDASTGGEYHYTYAGVTYLAHTPRGSFVIQRKIDGVRMSNLGYLYRPSYFTGGYAIHGEGYDVPVKPGSHGCVRVTDYNADILFPLLVVGTPVHLYDE